MTARQEEKLQLSEIISNTYNNKDDLYDDIMSKIELFKHISVDNSTLEYSFAMYANELQIMVNALKLIKE